MLSRNRASRTWIVALSLAVVLQTGDCAESGPMPGHVPDRLEIAHAVQIVKADPNLGKEHKVRTLHWVDETHRPTGGISMSFRWLLELMGWVAKSARVLVWVGIAILTAMLVTYLIRLLRSRKPYAKTTRARTPTHVLDLDIRPESLPSDIGATARGLWDTGEHRAALSLLYRGLLSRLAHVHSVPIRESSTEGDCLRLAAARLREVQRDYMQRLIQIWLRAVYGGQQPETGSLYALCDEFAPALDAP